MQKITLGLGCFWGPEENFKSKPGIIATEVGYAGGFSPNVTYEEVCTGRTGHAEVVRVILDKKSFSWNELFQIFWESHDPTQLNRQGFDIGNQYRSIIFYYSENQKLLAEESKKQKQESLLQLIVTDISPAKEFYSAEEYHQLYIYKKK